MNIFYYELIMTLKILSKSLCRSPGFFFIFLKLGWETLRMGDLNSVIISRSHFIYPYGLVVCNNKTLKKQVILCLDIKRLKLTL